MRRNVSPLNLRLEFFFFKIISRHWQSPFPSSVFDARLDVVDLAVDAILANQLIMLAALDDLSFIQHQDQVGVHHALDAVGDDEGGAVFPSAFQRLADLRLGFRVHRRGGVIQDQDARVF